MNTTVADPDAWSPRRRWITIGAIALAQIGLLFLFAERASSNPRAKNRDELRVLLNPFSEEQLSQSLLASDPTLFVLPSPQGFSGAAWLAFKPREYQPLDWDESPRWLSANPGELGKTFIRFIQTNSHYDKLKVANKLPPPLEMWMLVESVKSTGRKSGLKIEGDIKTRLISSLPELPSWNHTEPLLDSVVQVAVNRAGDVVASRLVSSSGLSSANQKALEIVRTMRFRPLNSEQAATALSWGTFIFQWQTLPSPLTNILNPPAVAP